MKTYLNFHRGLLLTGLAVFLIGSLLSCSDQQNLPEIKVGVIAPLTGEKSAIGQATVEAAELAVSAINQAGGLQVGNQKRCITLIIKDDQDQQTSAVAAALQLINQENVVALTGLHISRNAIPVAEIAESSRIPMIAGKSTNPRTTAGKQYVFRVAFTDLLQGQVLARFTRNDLQITKAAVLYDEASAYNRDIARIYKKVFEESEGEVVAFETYVTGQKDFSTQLTTIKDAGAEILFLPNYYHEVPLQVSQARKIGLTIPVIGADSWGVLQSKDLPLMEGAFYTSHFTADTESEAARKFVVSYQTAYGKTPIDVAAVTYDSFGMLFKAITQQGKTDPHSIRQGLTRLGSYQGVTGEILYQGSGDPIKSIIIAQIKEGKPMFYKFIKPTP